MEQVGNDFSIKAAASDEPFPGNFVLDGSLRVPWAWEPACQSCHTGDAVNKNHPATDVPYLNFTFPNIYNEIACFWPVMWSLMYL